MSGLIGIGLSFLTAVLKSSSSIVSKELLDTDIGPYASSWAVRFFGIPILVLSVVIAGGIPNIQPNFYLYLSINSIAGVVATISYMKALDISDISVVDPISALSPLLLLITTPFIVGEFPSIAGLIGVMVIVSGVYLLKAQDSGDGVLQPIKGIVSDPASKYVGLMILIYSVTAPIDKLAVEASGSIFYSLSLHIFQGAILTIVLIYMSDSWRSDMFSRDTLKLSVIGLLSGLSSMFQMIAITYTLVIYVISIKRLGILIGTMWGVFVRGEEGGWIRIAGSGLIIVGSILITISI